MTLFGYHEYQSMISIQTLILKIVTEESIDRVIVVIFHYHFRKHFDSDCQRLQSETRYNICLFVPASFAKYSVRKLFPSFYIFYYIWIKNHNTNPEFIIKTCIWILVKRTVYHYRCSNNLSHIASNLFCDDCYCFMSVMFANAILCRNPGHSNLI